MPKSYTTEKEKYIDTYISDTMKSEKRICTRYAYMEEHDKQYCQAHQFSTEPANICKF